MNILYFDPTSCEEPKKVDYSYSPIPKTVGVISRKGAEVPKLYDPMEDSESAVPVV